MGDQDKDVIARGRRLWTARAGRELSGDEVREIQSNLAGFFRLLKEWDEAEKRERNGPADSNTAARGRPRR